MFRRVRSKPNAAASASPPRDTVYLSLGTSLAAGSQADSAGLTTDSSNRSYTDQLYQRLKGRIGPRLEHVKLGCRGETTDQLLGGTTNGVPSYCTGDYDTGSQIGDAIQTVAEENVVLITIDIGANDILQAQNSCPDGRCLPTAIGEIVGKVGTILYQLREVAGYDGPIVGMNYYNPQAAIAIGFYPGYPGPLTPDPTLAMQADGLAQAFNGALATVFANFEVELADVYAAFNSGDFGDDRPANGTPDNVDVLCRLSYMCPDPGIPANIHLNDKGYRVVAKTFLGVVAGIEFEKTWRPAPRVGCRF